LSVAPVSRNNNVVALNYHKYYTVKLGTNSSEKLNCNELQRGNVVVIEFHYKNTYLIFKILIMFPEIAKLSLFQHFFGNTDFKKLNLTNPRYMRPDESAFL